MSRDDYFLTTDWYVDFFKKTEKRIKELTETYNLGIISHIEGFFIGFMKENPRINMIIWENYFSLDAGEYFTESPIISLQKYYDEIDFDEIILDVPLYEPTEWCRKEAKTSVIYKDIVEEYDNFMNISENKILNENAKNFMNTFYTNNFDYIFSQKFGEGNTVIFYRTDENNVEKIIKKSEDRF